MFEAQAIVQSVASSASNGEMPLPTLRVEVRWARTRTDAPL